MATEVRRGRKPRAIIRAMRGARDLYIRGVKGFDKFVAAANPRAGVGRPTSGVFGGGDRDSERELRELVRAMEARRGAATRAAGGKKDRTTDAAARRGNGPLERIDEDGTPVCPTR